MLHDSCDAISFIAKMNFDSKILKVQSFGLRVCLPPHHLSIPLCLTRGLISREDLWLRTSPSAPTHSQTQHPGPSPPLDCTKPPLCNTMVATPFAFPLYPLVWLTHNSAPFSLWPVFLLSSFLGFVDFFFFLLFTILFRLISSSLL